MVALWGSGTSNPKAIPGEQGQVGLPKLINGIDSAFTWNWATVNPGTAVGTEYDTGDHGSPWWDVAVASGASTLNPMLHCWVDDGAAGSVMRRMCWHYLKWLDAPASILAKMGTLPRTADDAVWTAVDIASDISGVREVAGKHVAIVLLYLRFSDASTTVSSLGAAGSYIAFRKKGVAASEQRFPVLQPAIEHTAVVFVPLDVGDEFEFQIKIGAGGTPSFAVPECKIHAFFEDF